MAKGTVAVLKASGVNTVRGSPIGRECGGELGEEAAAASVKHIQRQRYIVPVRNDPVSERRIPSQSSANASSPLNPSRTGLRFERQMQRDRRECQRST